MATAEPTSIPSSARGSMKVANWASCPARLAWNTRKSKRISTYRATLVEQAAKNAVTMCGAKV